LTIANFIIYRVNIPYFLNFVLRLDSISIV